MRNLDIRAVEEFPLEVIGASTSLEKLSLLGSFSLGAQGPLIPAHRRAVLKSLTLQYCTASLPRINAWSNSQAGHEISQLTHFRATVWREADYEQLPSILSACAGSLKVLELDPGIEVNLRNVASAPDSGLQPEARPLFSSATFSLRTTLSTLKHLQLHLAVEAYQSAIMNASRQLVSSWFTPFEWVGRLLEELRPPRTRHPIASSSPSNSNPITPSLVLEQLTLNISFRVDPNSTIFSEASWAPLATSLSSFSEAVPSLRRVLICATGGENHPLFDRDENGRKKIVETLERDVALAPLVAKGLLKVTSVDDEE